MKLLFAMLIVDFHNQGLHSPDIPSLRLVVRQAAERGRVVDMHSLSDGLGPQRTPVWAAIWGELFEEASLAHLAKAQSI